jgi:hypothetical protein
MIGILEKHTVSSVITRIFIARLVYDAMEVLGNISSITRVHFGYNAIKHVVTGHKELQ